MGKDVLNTIVEDLDSGRGPTPPQPGYIEFIFLGGVIDKDAPITKSVIENLALTEKVATLPHTTTVPLNPSGLPQNREYPLFAFPKSLNWEGDYEYSAFITSTIFKEEIQITDSEGYSYLVDVYIGSAPLTTSIVGCKFLVQ